MTNLSKRVEKAKGLAFSHNIHEPGEYGTWGSKGDYYHVDLSHTSEVFIITNPDGTKKINMTVLLAECQADTGIGTMCNCPGNERNTVCYHSLGAVYQSFQETGKLVSFFETYESAKQMSFGGKIAKVKSVNGNGYLWCVIKDWPKKLTAEENINLMRGQENDEGID